MNTALVKCTYKQFQSEQRLVIEEGTKQDDSFTVVVSGKPKTISFDSMLVIADDSNGGAIQLRDIDVGDNINGINCCCLWRMLIEEQVESWTQRDRIIK